MPVNARPFWKHGLKQFAIVLLWGSALLVGIMGLAGLRTDNLLNFGFVLLAMAPLGLAGLASLTVAIASTRAIDESKRELYGRAQLRILVVTFLYLFGWCSFLVVYGILTRGWVPPALPVGVLIGSVVALMLYIGLGAVHALLLGAKWFELAEGFVRPTCYGKLLHHNRAIRFEEITKAHLVVAEPTYSLKGPPRFRWYIECARFGRCDVNSDELSEAKTPLDVMQAIYERIRRINKTVGGTTGVLFDRLEELREQAGGELRNRSEGP